MNVKNLRVSLQLKIGFAVIILFVLILGAVSSRQIARIHEQASILYLHPMTVRDALFKYKAACQNIFMGTRDLVLARDDQEKLAALKLIEVSDEEINQQYLILLDKYLGSQKDLDALQKSLAEWRVVRDETIKMATSGEIEKARANIGADHVLGRCRNKLLDEIQTIDDFSKTKAASLYSSSEEMVTSINRQMVLLVATILLFSIIIIYVVLRNIRRPLNELISVTDQFRQGKLDIRSQYDSTNEYGLLSASFNSLAETIQSELLGKDNSAQIADVMMDEKNLHVFCQELLKALIRHTGSQVGAVYLLNQDGTDFEHFESIGLAAVGHASFSAAGREGEFGAALATRQIQHLTDIPADTRFTFTTVSGDFRPREIITIPVLSDGGIAAVISLVSIRKYPAPALRLVKDVWNVINARVMSALALGKIRAFSDKLEHQNRELETQKTELSSQSAELTEQNTELEMQKAHLNEANRLKTNFLSNMSHELRTPLNSVIALSGVLSRRLAKQIPEEEHSYLEVIERNGKHLLTLINDVLDISRIESGREEIEITEFNPKSLIAELVSMIRPQAKQKNIELLQNESDPDLFISSDAHKFQHILVNIIGNAVKFTEDGKIEVTIRQSDKNIVITVTDTGIGIAEEHIAHIFDEFRQADNSTSRRFGGTGLGLAIAKKYANLLGGTVSVKSTLGTGSEFTLTLPLRYDARNAANLAASGHVWQEEKTKTASRLPRNAGNLPASANVWQEEKIKTASRLLAVREDEDCQQVVYPPQAAPKATRAGGPIRNASTVKTILLVEDSEPAIIQLKDFLEQSGCLVLVAHNGGEALGIIAQTIPDAMILDLMMPGIDGFEVLQTIREAERTVNIPVLILTAKQISKEELKFLTRNNIHQLIQKGDVKRSELLEAVEKMLFPEKEEAVKTVRKSQTIEGKPVVLIVEDNPDNMLTARAILANDYSVLEAVDGHEAVEMAKKHKPHLILMDIELPGMDGISAFKAIRNDVKLQHIPIIALTASAMVSDREEILAYGFDAYIAKPIEEKPFFRTIREVMGME